MVEGQWTPQFSPPNLITVVKETSKISSPQNSWFLLAHYSFCLWKCVLLIYMCLYVRICKYMCVIYVHVGSGVMWSRLMWTGRTKLKGGNKQFLVLVLLCSKRVSWREILCNPDFETPLSWKSVRSPWTVECPEPLDYECHTNVGWDRAWGGEPASMSLPLETIYENINGAS